MRRVLYVITHGIIPEILRGMALFVLSLLFLLSVQYVFERWLTPTDYWVAYKKVIPEVVYAVDEQPQFISFSKYPHGGRGIWNDIMRCDTNNDGVFEFYSEYTVTNDHVKVRKDFTATPWIYQGKIPSKSAQCFMEDNITLITPGKVQRTTSVVTDTFYFVPPDQIEEFKKKIKAAGDGQSSVQLPASTSPTSSSSSSPPIASQTFTPTQSQSSPPPTEYPQPQPQPEPAAKTPVRDLFTDTVDLLDNQVNGLDKGLSKTLDSLFGL